MSKQSSKTTEDGYSIRQVTGPSSEFGENFPKITPTRYGVRIEHLGTTIKLNIPSHQVAQTETNHEG